MLKRLSDEEKRRIAELYNEGLKIADISKKLNLAWTTVWCYTRGREILEEQGKEFSIKNLKDYLAQKRGYNDHNIYSKILRIRKSDSKDSKKRRFEQKKLKIGVYPPISMQNSIVTDSPLERLEKKELSEIIQKILEELENSKDGPRMREVIEGIFFEGVPMRVIGERLGITCEMVRQVERKALWKMSFPAKRYGLEDYL